MYPQLGQTVSFYRNGTLMTGEILHRTTAEPFSFESTTRARPAGMTIAAPALPAAPRKPQAQLDCEARGGTWYGHPLSRCVERPVLTSDVPCPAGTVKINAGTRSERCVPEPIKSTPEEIAIAKETMVYLDRPGVTSRGPLQPGAVLGTKEPPEKRDWGKLALLLVPVALAMMGGEGA